MSRDGVGSWVLAGLSARSMRVAGVVVTALATAVIVLSVATGYGLSLDGGSTAGAETTMQSSGSLTVDALVTVTLAHPAYPVAIVLGLALVALGDDVPLLGD